MGGGKGVVRKAGALSLWTLNLLKPPPLPPPSAALALGRKGGEVVARQGNLS